MRQLGHFFHSTLLLAIGAVILVVSSCKKPDGEPQTVQPRDSTKITVPTKNSLDSVHGTYYGHTVTRMMRYSGATYTVDYFYDGPDTVRLMVESPASGVISLQSPRLRGDNMFGFSTTGHMQGFNNHSTLKIWPFADSIEYQYGHIVETGPESGTWSTSSFRGKK